MSPRTDTTADTALRPAPGRVNPLPEWVSTTDRNALPNILYWTSEAARPPINCRVDVIRFGIPLGTGTAVAYFHRDGELGILVELDSVAPSLDLPAGTRRAHFFGENITRLDQGDEPENEQGAPAADNADVQDVFFFKTNEAAGPLPEVADTDDTDEANEANDTDESDDLGTTLETPA